MRPSDPRQTTLFETGPPPQAETPLERARRQNRERQRSWRRRRAF